MPISAITSRPFKAARFLWAFFCIVLYCLLPSGPGLLAQERSLALVDPIITPGRDGQLPPPKRISIVTDEIARAIDQQTTYILGGRRNVDTKAVVDNIKLEQTSGLVDYEGWQELGRLMAVKYLCVSRITEGTNRTYVSYTLIGSERGNIVKLVSGNFKKDNDIFTLECRALAKTLFGITVPIKDDLGWHIGGQVSGVMPLGDFADLGAMGFGAAAFGEYVFNKGWAIRLRGEYLAFGEKEGEGRYDAIYNTFPARFNSSIVHIGVGVDGVYYNDSGFYVFAGLGVLNRKNNGIIEFYHTGEDKWYQGDYWENAVGGRATNAANLAISVGAGYYFHKNVGVEIKHTTAGAGWIQGALCVRF